MQGVSIGRSNNREKSGTQHPETSVSILRVFFSYIVCTQPSPTDSFRNAGRIGRNMAKHNQCATVYVCIDCIGEVFRDVRRFLAANIKRLVLVVPIPQIVCTPRRMWCASEGKKTYANVVDFICSVRKTTLRNVCSCARCRCCLTAAHTVHCALNSIRIKYQRFIEKRQQHQTVEKKCNKTTAQHSENWLQRMVTRGI